MALRAKKFNRDIPGFKAASKEALKLDQRILSARVDEPLYLKLQKYLASEDMYYVDWLSQKIKEL